MAVEQRIMSRRVMTPPKQLRG